MAKFMVVGSNTVIVSGGVEYREGDVIELSSEVQVAELRFQLDPVDQEAKALLPDEPGKIAKTLPKHEREFLLGQRKQKLEQELKAVQEELRQLEADN